MGDKSTKLKIEGSLCSVVTTRILAANHLLHISIYPQILAHHGCSDYISCLKVRADAHTGSAALVRNPVNRIHQCQHQNSIHQINFSMNMNLDSILISIIVCSIISVKPRDDTAFKKINISINSVSSKSALGSLPLTKPQIFIKFMEGGSNPFINM